MARAALPPAPPSPVTGTSSPSRALVTATRPVDDLRAIRRRWGTSINDAVLAVCAGALRAFVLRRGEEPGPLKAMVPVDVRDASGPGNHITFVYLRLPCDEPDPVMRLMQIHRASAQHKRRGDAEGTDAALQALALAPRTLRRAAARFVASPRMYHVVVSSLPGPSLPVHLAGFRLRAIHPAVPLAAGHALSIGVCTVGGDACFGFYADRIALPGAAELAGDLDGAVEELLRRQRLRRDPSATAICRRQPIGLRAVHSPRGRGITAFREAPQRQRALDRARARVAPARPRRHGGRAAHQPDQLHAALHERLGPAVVAGRRVRGRGPVPRADRRGRAPASSPRPRSTGRRRSCSRRT